MGRFTTSNCNAYDAEQEREQARSDDSCGVTDFNNGVSCFKSKDFDSANQCFGEAIRKANESLACNNNYGGLEQAVIFNATYDRGIAYLQKGMVDLTLKDFNSAVHNYFPIEEVVEIRSESCVRQRNYIAVQNPSDGNRKVGIILYHKWSLPGLNNVVYKVLFRV